MLSEKQKQQLIEELKKCNSDISEIRKELNILNDLKESAFSAKQQIGKQIVEQIRIVKKLKSERDKFTVLVKENKKKRRELRTEINKLISSVKELNSQKKSLMKKHNLKHGPDRLMEEIQKLETKIETEAIAFKDEKKLMKRIKDLKKKLDESKDYSEVFANAKKISKQIDNMKVDLEKCHAEVQNFAKLSQEKHEHMIEISKQIDDLKKKEKEHLDKFQEAKDKFTEINEKLKAKLPMLNELKEKLDKDKKETREEKKKKVEKVLKEKETKVNDKIKRGQKLTTEDLLVFQRTNSEDNSGNSR